jgi:hypothetical protein
LFDKEQCCCYPTTHQNGFNQFNADQDKHEDTEQFQQLILDVKDLPGTALLGIAAIILSLTVGYYLIRKTNEREPSPGKK